MVGNNAKCGCLFENVRGNVLMLAECASGTVCFSIQGEAAPMLHADDSLLQFHLTSLSVMPILPSRVAEEAYGYLDPLEGTEMRVLKEYRTAIPLLQVAELSPLCLLCHLPCMAEARSRHREWLSLC